MPRKSSNPTGKGGFKKGQSGNPGGRSKKRVELEESIRKLLETEDGRNVAIQRLKEIAEFADRPSDSIKAYELLLAYGYGKPTQRKEVSGVDGNPIETTSKVTVYLPDNGRGS